MSSPKKKKVKKYAALDKQHSEQWRCLSDREVCKKEKQRDR